MSDITETPDWLKLPENLVGESNDVLVDRYVHLSNIKLAGETRVGRHPSDRNNPADVEKDAEVRAVLDVGLRYIVREMGQIMHELGKRKVALMPDGTWQSYDKKE